MIPTSALYKELRAQEGSWYETQVVRGAVIYGDNPLHPYEKKIEKLSINPALFDDNGPQIGIARAAKCTLQIYEDKRAWPRMASFLVRMRLHSADDSQVSEWINKGVFFTDRRKPDVFGMLTITAMDGMLLLEQSWTDKVAQLPEKWPITAAAAAPLLVEATGIELEDDGILDDAVAFIGLNTKATAREVWSDIAAAHACNLQLTTEGKLRLVPYTQLATYTGAVVDQAVAGIAIVNALGSGYTGAVADKAIANMAIAGTQGDEPDNFFKLGLAVSSLDTGDDLPAITGVELTTETGMRAAAGNAEGYVIKGICNFSDSAAAELCLSRISRKFYRPFDASTAHIDIAAEPGDLVSINNVIYQIASMDWTICAMPTADIAAEFEEEIDHEYTVLSEGGKALRIAVDSVNRLETFLQTDFAETVQDLQGQIDGKAQTWYQDEDPAKGWTDEEARDHIGDLWRRTTDGTTWIYTENGWEQMGVPEEVFDAIDGKAQIFVTQPVPPYSVGDLWFAGAGADIMTCIAPRETGSFSASDWRKYNKYTDDTAADKVATDLRDNYLTAAKTRSAIEQSAASIRQSVAAQYVSNTTLSDTLADYSPTAQIQQNYYSKSESDKKADALASEIELTDSRLTLAFSQLRADTNDAVNAISYYIRYEDGVVIIGKTDSPTSIRISNEQIGLYYDGELLSYWNQDRQYTPKALQIPTGGSFTLGSVLYQPRNSGNLSLMWVGGS